MESIAKLIEFAGMAIQVAVNDNSIVDMNYHRCYDRQSLNLSPLNHEEAGCFIRHFAMIGGCRAATGFL